MTDKTNPIKLTPMSNHWGLYANKTGLTQIGLVDVHKYNDLRQTFFAGALALAAVCEKRGMSLDQIDDVIGELVQFSKSQGEPSEKTPAPEPVSVEKLLE